jgi:hypothetical protein
MKRHTFIAAGSNMRKCKLCDKAHGDTSAHVFAAGFATDAIPKSRADGLTPSAHDVEEDHERMSHFCRQ